MAQRFGSTQSETIGLNNLGASLIEANSYTSAIKILNNALCLVHQQLQCDGEEEPARLAADSDAADNGNEDHVFGSSLTGATGELREWCQGKSDNSDRAIQMETSSNCSTSTTVRSSASAIPTPMVLVDDEEEVVETASCASSTGEGIEEESSSVKTAFVYRTPIRLGNHTAANHRASKTVATLSLTIIFNLAVAHHLKGMSSNTQCQKHLDAGLKLYEICYDLLMEEHRQLHPSLPTFPRSEEDALSPSSCSTDDHDDENAKDSFYWTISQSMGLIHNCGQILQLLSSSSSPSSGPHSTSCFDPTTKAWKQLKADRFFEHLLTSVVMIVECGMADEVEDLDGFVRATEHLILSKTSMAQAA